MRIIHIKLVVLLSFILLITGLARIQLFNGPCYKRQSRENRVRLIPIRAARGNIYDREGKLLAKSRLSFNAAVIPREAGSNSSTLTKLSVILEIPVAALRQKLKQNAVNPFVPAVVAEDIPKEKAILIEEKSLRLKGVVIETVPLREYVYEESTAHLIGYITKLTWQEYKKLRFYGYRIVDFIGRTGLEAAFDSYLKGEDGGYQIEVDNKGKRIKVLGHKAPQKGKDLQLTIDIELQNYIYSLTKQRKAAVCVINPLSGEVLSMVSTPSFNPNIIVSPSPQRNRKVKAIFNSKDSVMTNRNIQSAYPTGSVFKIVTALCALETRAVDAGQTINCPGHFKLGKSTFRCWYSKGHGEETIVDALKNSCNVFFYKAGLEAGIDSLSSYARKFGFGRPTGIELGGEAAGLVPDKEWKLKEKGERWYDGETVIFAIGQGYFLATPIQILRMISVIANGGNLIYPQIVKKIADLEAGSKKPRRLNFKKKNLNIVRRGLELVVSASGTGRRAQVEGVKVAGKTATAQTSSGPTHACFSCFFPADKPEFALVVFLEHGGTGGVEAAGVSRQIIEFIKRKYL
ncbi:MAG: penicillin-binding protein 2 [Candidatus Omnitrophica bacterium]|nr:penicillin-binding protein 2 [Candidatus Omnitrophota bacterium]